jgi:hypothetical protein
MRIGGFWDVIGAIFLVTIIALLLRNSNAVTSFVNAFKGLLTTAVQGR